MSTDFMMAVRNATLRASNAQRAIDQFSPATAGTVADSTGGMESPYRSSKMRQDIFNALADIEQRLADGYAQAYADLEDPGRVSWAGTAHEIREIIATILRHLAHDDSVKGMAWYRPESVDGRPTQKQRVRFILESRRVSSSEQEVSEQVGLIEERVANLVRLTYGRASDAAHRGKRRTEAGRILNYFEAFAHDLLDLP